MSKPITLLIDGVEVQGRPGQTILQAAEAAGIYIPRLCFLKGLAPYGSCRVCTVMVSGRPQSACIQPIADGMIVENDTPKLAAVRRDLIEMLLIEGNHYCMYCEKSGNCELQALAYRFGITAPKYPYLWPEREIDASHGDVILDRNRCVLCARCLRASRDVDGKSVFGMVGRGPERSLAVGAQSGLADTDIATTDRAMDVCPVGSLMPKRVGFKVPIGQRPYDAEPIGSGIEKPRNPAP